MSNRQPSWPGHYTITLYALEALSKKWSANPATEIPRTERVFYVACAFRAAAAMGALSDFFNGEMIHQLQNAREACAEIGTFRRKNSAARPEDFHG